VDDLRLTPVFMPDAVFDTCSCPRKCVRWMMSSCIFHFDLFSFWCIVCFGARFCALAVCGWECKQSTQGSLCIDFILNICYNYFIYATIVYNCQFIDKNQKNTRKMSTIRHGLLVTLRLKMRFVSSSVIFIIF